MAARPRHLRRNRPLRAIQTAHLDNEPVGVIAAIVAVINSTGALAIAILELGPTLAPLATAVVGNIAILVGAIFTRRRTFSPESVAGIRNLNR